MPGQHILTSEAAAAGRSRTAHGDGAGDRHRTVRALGTTEGAALLAVSKARFTRLARLGLLVPVAFRPDRHRAAVWLYSAAELTLFASGDEHAPLLTGRMPESLRGQLDTGIDLRPRNWRTRHLGHLLRRADGPWALAGAVASLLAPLHRAQTVTDPRDRCRLTEHLVPPPHGTPGSPASRVAQYLMTARDPDEIAWLRSELARLTQEAREREAREPEARAPEARERWPAAPSAPPRTGPPGETRQRGHGPRGAPGRLGRPPTPRRPVTYSARNNPSCTTDTSIRPSRS
ncbi:DUF6397 family protein [Streptomyces griseoflavus]|uniref:DUF6397 family protein n=1 Tax=Streptomyces griseoflavus TaxID=35619 RepID=UPI0033A69843